MTAKAATVKALLPELQQNASAGNRLGAIAILQSFPNAAHLEWLAERLNHEQERPFVGYQAAVALLEAVRSLPATNCGALRAALERASTLAARLTTDPPRIRVLEAASIELKRKCGKAKGAAASGRRKPSSTTPLAANRGRRKR